MTIGKDELLTLNEVLDDLHTGTTVPQDKVDKAIDTVYKLLDSHEDTQELLGEIDSFMSVLGRLEETAADVREKARKVENGK